MPKKEINDYIFYKIVCLDDSCELCYVGSTANWKARVSRHKCCCTNENIKGYNYKVYKTIRANGGWDNFKMVELGKTEQLTVRQAEKIEEYYREELKASMNGRRCYLSEEQKRQNNKEYREANIDRLNEYIKEYREANKDKIKAKASEVIMCECGCQFRRGELSQHKKSKKHIRLMELVQNKDNTNDKFVCECGCHIGRIDGLARHKKTQKHIRLMELLQND